MVRPVPVALLMLVVGCGHPSVPSPAQGANASQKLEVIVKNDGDFPITVEAVWEDGKRTSLGEIGGRGQSRSFTVDYRDRGLSVFAKDATGGVRADVNDHRNRRIDPPTKFFEVRRGDHVGVTIVYAGPNGGYFEPRVLSPEEIARMVGRG